MRHHDETCGLYGRPEDPAFCLWAGMRNLGATLDLGHALYAEEWPARAAVLLAKAERLFCVHLNDNDGRWDWDMLPGAFHFWETVEFLYVLRKIGYTDDWYASDVYPKEINTAENFAAAFQITRKLEALTDRIDPAKRRFHTCTRCRRARAQLFA